MDEEKIAQNIKTLRIRKKLSLDRLAKLSGLTKGYLSKIENSDKAPPISTLAKIASVLDTDVGTLLFGEKSNVSKGLNLSIVRRGQIREFVGDGTLYRYHYRRRAFKKRGKGMDPYILIPGSREVGIFVHKGEEFIYVLEGKHRFVYGGKKYILGKGDSVYFDSSIPHTGDSVGKKKCKVLAVMLSYGR